MPTTTATGGSHLFADEYVAHLYATQQAYVERRLADYLAGFSEEYYSVQLGTEWGEDKAGLAAKIEADFSRFELLSMNLDVRRVWFSGQIGYGYLAYTTRLRDSSSERVLLDRRENILVGEHLGAGRWLIVCKIVVRAENVYE